MPTPWMARKTGAQRCVESRTLSVVGNCPGRPRSPGGRTADEAGHVERLGHPNPVRKPSRLTIRTRTRMDRCGRTTTASSPPAFAATDLQRRLRASPATAAKRRSTSYRIRCPSSTPGFTATRPTFPSSISEQTSRKPGPQDLSLLSANDSRLSAGRAEQKALHRSCAAGMAADLEVSDLRVGAEKFDLRFWRDGEGPGGKCSREIRAPSSLAASPARVNCRSKSSIAIGVLLRPGGELPVFAELLPNCTNSRDGLSTRTDTVPFMRCRRMCGSVATGA